MKAILMLLVCAAGAFAQPQQSANFRMTNSVLDAGGGLSTSANFRMTCALGQPTPIGLQNSANFFLVAGFLSPAFRVSPLSPIQALVIRPNLPNVTLHWPRVSAAAVYKIYRADQASFTPSVANLLGAVTDTTFTDTDAATLPFGEYFYIVTALNFGGGLMTVAEPARPDTIDQTRAEAKAPPSVFQKR